VFYVILQESIPRDHLPVLFRCLSTRRTIDTSSFL
jgi:hypothetical protein